MDVNSSLAALRSIVFERKQLSPELTSSMDADGNHSRQRSVDCYKPKVVLSDAPCVRPALFREQSMHDRWLRVRYHLICLARPSVP